MGKIFVSGHVNQEVNLKIKSFPLAYNSVNFPFFGINTSISGVGLNIAKSLHTLGDEVVFLSIIGNDQIGKNAIQTVEGFGVSSEYLLPKLNETCESVILFDATGRRQIHCDLKNIQDLRIDEDTFLKAQDGCEVLCLCNINFNRGILRTARSFGKIIATDVHAISGIDDVFNQDFMATANILFFSDDNLKEEAESFVLEVENRFGNDIIIVGRGASGAYMYVKGEKQGVFVPAVATRPVINTIGAGDALFSSFIHFYNKTKDPHSSLSKAVVYASYKIGENGAAKGFLKENELEKLLKTLK